MAQPFLDYLGMYSPFQRDRGVGMPGVMQPDIFHPGVFGSVMPGPGDGVGPEGLPVNAGEYPTVFREGQTIVDQVQLPPFLGSLQEIDDGG